MKLKIAFKTKDNDGNDLDLAVCHPTVDQKHRGQIEYNKAFAEALAGGALLRLKLDQYMRAQSIWDDAKEAERVVLDKRIREGELALERGGIKKSQAKDIAIQLIRDRAAMRELIAERSSLDNVTVEAQADNARFNYYVASCTVFNDTTRAGQPYFRSLQDYLEKGTEVASIEAATKMMALLYGIDSDYESKLPENKFLKKFKYVDDSGRFINEKGQFVNVDGKLVNEDGRYIDENGGLVDFEGNPVDVEGNITTEILPFLDDDGNPLEDEVPEKQSKKTKKV